jgi:hypothetical protein
MIRSFAPLALATFALASCSGSQSGTPSATLPVSGKWQWVNTNASYAQTVEQDKATCSTEADAIQSRLSQCNAAPPSDCEKLADNAAKAMCQYSNSTTKNMCSVGRMAIPKQEIVDGCIAARGWKQVWAKAGG